MFSMDEEAYRIVVSNLYANGALNINFENPYLLSSGVKSPLYIDAGVLISDFGSRSRICGSILFWINRHHPEIDAVVGIANGGTAWSSSVANNKLIPLLYALPKPKDHGLNNQIVGELPHDGAKVVVIDDVITTGKSAISVVEALRNGKNGKKAEVLAVYSVFDWEFPEVNEEFKAKGIEKHNLVTIDSLFKYGVENGLLDVDVEKRLREFYQEQCK